MGYGARKAGERRTEFRDHAGHFIDRMMSKVWYIRLKFAIFILTKGRMFKKP